MGSCGPPATPEPGLRYGNRSGLWTAAAIGAVSRKRGQAVSCRRVPAGKRESGGRAVSGSSPGARHYSTSKVCSSTGTQGSSAGDGTDGAQALISPKQEVLVPMGNTL